MEARRRLTQEEREQLLGDCYEDPVLFCQIFLHELFYLPVPWVHRGLLAILTERTRFLLKYGELKKIVENFVHEYGEGESRQIFHVFEGEKELSVEDLGHLDEEVAAGTVRPGLSIKLDLGTYTLIQMPRGSSKTTIAGLAVPLYKLLYQDDAFTLYVSKADKHSQGQLESVRRQLVDNELILECFGDLKPRRSDEERWAKEKFETTTGVAMQARGKGSAIRGINHNNVRPSTIIVDDPQSKADVKSDTMREDDKKWAFAELTPARSQLIGSEGRMIALGTYLHRQCVINIWANDPKWTVVKLGVVDRDKEFIWPAYMNQEKHDQERESFARAGLLSDFYMEYYNEEVVESEIPFPTRFVIYEPPPADIPMVCATYADLATSEKRWADYSCITTVGMTTKGLLYILDVWMERTSDEERKIDEYFRQSLAWGSLIHGFESNAYQAVFGNLLREAMFRKGHYFEITPVLHKTRKIDRVMGALRPRYASGYVRQRARFPLYEAQLYDFRTDNSHEHDDGPDAVAAAITLLDPVAAYAAGEDITADSEESVEDLVGGEWRVAS